MMCHQALIITFLCFLLILNPVVFGENISEDAVSFKNSSDMPYFVKIHRIDTEPSFSLNFCAGTRISTNFVLTAATCVTNTDYANDTNPAVYISHLGTGAENGNGVAKVTKVNGPFHISDDKYVC